MKDGAELDGNKQPEKKAKRINGLVVLGLIVLVIMVTRYRPDIPKIHCNDEILASKPEVIMLSTWWCPYCVQARRYFHDNAIHYCEYDAEHSAEGKKLYDESNVMGVPVLMIGKYTLSGFDANSIEQALLFLRSDDDSRD